MKRYAIYSKIIVISKFNTNKTRDSPPSSLFALIIGINKYKDPDVPDLHGAVPDANEVQKFLISKVGVAENRIVILRDAEATREKIVHAIQNLAQNPAISTQDPILIFYAGHGGEAPSPWKTSSENDMIQMLIPHDFVSKGSKDHQGQGIFDITLSKLLADVAKKKSDNIVSCSIRFKDSVLIRKYVDCYFRLLSLCLKYSDELAR